jgi:hypothetical protein
VDAVNPAKTGIMTIGHLPIEIFLFNKELLFVYMQT